MKWIVLSCVLAAGVIASAEKYTDRYDDINLDEIIENRKLLIPYIKCVLDQGKCTPDGKELKLHMKEAIQTSCENCTDKQRQGARKMVKHIRAHEEDFWKQLLAKYDPDNIYKETYEAFLARDD